MFAVMTKYNFTDYLPVAKENQTFKMGVNTLTSYQNWHNQNWDSSIFHTSGCAAKWSTQHHNAKPLDLASSL